MSFTIIFLVIIFAIIVLFSDDFAKLGRKIFEIRGMKLLLPLLAASTVISYFSFFFIWMLDVLINSLAFVIESLANILPLGSYSVFFAIIFLLMTVVVLLGPLAIFIFKKLDTKPILYRQQLLLFVWATIAILTLFMYH